MLAATAYMLDCMHIKDAGCVVARENDDDVNDDDDDDDQLRIMKRSLFLVLLLYRYTTTVHPSIRTEVERRSEHHHCHP